MIKLLVENGYPVNLTSTREESKDGNGNINKDFWSKITVTINDKELFSEKRFFIDNESRKSYIFGIMKGMEIALR